MGKTAAKRDKNGRFLPGHPGGPGRGNVRRTVADGGQSALARIDGFQSAITGVGTATYDKRVGAGFCGDLLTMKHAADLWQGNPLAGRIVETWPNEMLREGYDLVISDDRDRDRGREIAEQVEARLEELGTDDELWTGLAYDRAYGGSAILMGARDNRVLSVPLEPKRVSEINYLNTFEPDELTPRFWYDDPRHPKFGHPSHFEINAVAQGPGRSGSTTPGPILVHESRLLIFPGIRVSRHQRAIHSYFGGSVLNRVFAILRDHGMGYDAAALLMHDFAQAVYRVKGLAEASIQDHDDAIKARLQAVELARSVIRAVVIDSEEDFGRQQTPITGLPELLDRFSTMLAAAADMPLTLLMGQSPGGMNATGESDIRFFYDRVRAAQRRILRPKLEILARIVMAEQGIEEPEKWSIEFRPLWQQSAKELAEARHIQAKTDELYIMNQVYSPEDAALSHFGGDRYSFEVSIDFDERKRLEEEAKELERQAQEQSILSAKAAAGEGGDDPPDDGSPERGDAIAEIVARYAGQ